MHLLKELDQWLLFLFNGSDSLFLDGMITVLTSGLTWIPLYVSLAYIVIKNHDTMPQIMLTIGCALLCVAVTAGVTNLLVKPLVARPRPCNDPFVKGLVDTVVSISQKDYSFFSAHAANTFSITVFLSLLVRNRAFVITLVSWSLLNCYTRLYLGFHYPSDIVCGLLFGGLMGFVLYIFYNRLFRMLSPQVNYVSSKYTPTGYAVSDIDLVISVFVFTLVYAAIHALIYSF
ncbi:MAG: phosphatase PAP2 family protein [Prevotellaceae bacterium]|nr:phosphatase PAP2 family protein [Prevotellaceae bacterium]